MVRRDFACHMRTSHDVHPSDLDVHAFFREMCLVESVVVCLVVSGVEGHTLGLDAHFQAGPEGLAGLVVPCVHNATAHMLSFWCGLVRVRRLLDVDGQLLLGPAQNFRSVSCSS